MADRRGMPSRVWVSLSTNFEGVYAHGRQPTCCHDHKVLAREYRIVPLKAKKERKRT